MIVVPILNVCARPVILMAATVGFDEFQSTDDVNGIVLSSVFIPVAEKESCEPILTITFTGVTRIDSISAGVIVRVVESEIFPWVALMTVVPTAIDAARPSEPSALLIVAISSPDEDHVTVVVMSSSKLFEYVPVALNCSVFPRGMSGSTGVTSIETREDSVTTRSVCPARSPALAVKKIAVIVVTPAAVVVAFPAMSISATEVSEDVHVTDLVRS